MNILVVDDEPIIKEGIVKLVRRCVPDAEVLSSDYGEEALALARQTPLDIAFLDIEMPGINGVALAKMLRNIKNDTNIIFTTAYQQYTDQAMQMHASGYILKPVTESKLKKELEDLRYKIVEPSEKTSDTSAKIVLRTFGNFEVFLNGRPLRFRYSKTRELLAYLTDRKGAMVRSQDIQNILWNDSADHVSYYKQLRKDLHDTLQSEGCEDILISVRGELGIVPGNVLCDYYEFLDGGLSDFASYCGEYMKQYDWAQETRDLLEKKVERND